MCTAIHAALLTDVTLLGSSVPLKRANTVETFPLFEPSPTSKKSLDSDKLNVLNVILTLRSSYVRNVQDGDVTHDGLHGGDIRVLVRVTSSSVLSITTAAIKYSRL